MIVVRGLRKDFGRRPVLAGIDLDVASGQVIALIGPSGAGKSTLLRCLNLLETPTAGLIRIDDLTIAEGRPDGSMTLAAPALRGRLRRRVGMVFQHFNLFSNLSARENIALAQVRVLRRTKREALERADELLLRVNLDGHRNAMPDRLSGGQKQRVAIARALSMDPEIMLFDEPTSAIDPELRAGVLAIMQELAQGGMTMLVCTHEMSFAEHVSDRVAFMADGALVEEGPPYDVLRAPRHERTRRFVSSVLGR